MKEAEDGWRLNTPCQAKEGTSQLKYSLVDHARSKMCLGNWRKRRGNLPFLLILVLPRWHPGLGGLGTGKWALRGVAWQ